MPPHVVQMIFMKFDCELDYYAAVFVVECLAVVTLVVVVGAAKVRFNYRRHFKISPINVL